MRAARTPIEEQLRLINECRQSGLTDHQWCQLHDIKPGTFYNWVNRLRKAGCIDAVEHSDTPAITPVQQEVVQVNIHPASPALIRETPQAASNLAPCMELLIGGVTLKLTNQVDPSLLATTLQLLKGLSC